MHKLFAMIVDIQMAVDASDAKIDGLHREKEALCGQVTYCA